MDRVGRVLKTLKPGQAGTKRFVKRFGGRLVAVRYRGNPKRRVRSTTIEIVVDEGFWLPYSRDGLCPDVDIPLNA